MLDVASNRLDSHDTSMYRYAEFVSYELVLVFSLPLSLRTLILSDRAKYAGVLNSIYAPRRYIDIREKEICRRHGC